MSSSFVRVTVVPALTLSSCGPKVKFPILTAVASAAQTGVAARRRKAATPATAMLMRDFVLDMFALNPVTKRCSLLQRVCVYAGETGHDDDLFLRDVTSQRC